MPASFQPGAISFAHMRACRPALLVDARLELLGLLEMAPAALQRQRLRRVPGQPDGRRIQRPRLDVPAMLVGLAAVEAADLDLEPVDAPGRRSARRSVMCVESSQWWLIGASGESMIASRCMKAGGPNAGSPGKPAVEEHAALRPDVLRDRGRQLHEEVVRMLAVDQMVDRRRPFRRWPAASG